MANPEKRKLEKTRRQLAIAQESLRNVGAQRDEALSRLEAKKSLIERLYKKIERLQTSRINGYLSIFRDVLGAIGKAVLRNPTTYIKIGVIMFLGIHYYDWKFDVFGM